MGCMTICVGLAIIFKQSAFAFVISASAVQSGLPHVCRPFIDAILGNLNKFTCTAAHAPDILAFIFLTRQICEMEIDQFCGMIAIKYAIVNTIVSFFPLSKCFTT